MSDANNTPPTETSSLDNLCPRLIASYPDRTVYFECNEPEFPDAIKARLDPDTYLHNCHERTITVVGDRRIRDAVNDIHREIYGVPFYVEFLPTDIQFRVVTMSRPDAEQLDAERDASYAGIGK